MSKNPKNPADYILPLNINGLQGRVLKMSPPKRKKREVLFIYGHHSDIERYFGVAEMINRYAGVTIPDLPGCGGMDPFYKIGQKPTLDNLADYLATFIKFRYKKNQRFTLAGYSMGPMIIIKMLQKYPEIAKRVDFLVSVAGFTHKDDFKIKKRTQRIFRWGSSFFSHRLTADFMRYVIFRRLFLRLGYLFIERFFIDKKHSKVRSAENKEERDRRINYEIHLWQCNEVRTYMELALSMFTLDLTHQHVDMPIYHVSVDDDRYFKNTLVEQHMRMIFSDFHEFRAKVPTHSPSVVATMDDAAPFIPVGLRRIFNKAPES